MNRFSRRWHRFKNLKRGYASFKIFIGIYLLSFLVPLFINSNPWIVKYKDNYFFPIIKEYSKEEIGYKTEGAINYRKLKKELQDSGQGWVMTAPYPYSPNENLLDETEGTPPHKPSVKNFFGTDDRGRDVFARVMYALNISLTFSLIVTLLSYLIGIIIGAFSGYLGGWVDIGIQRVTEIFLSLPFLYIIILISSIVQPGFTTLAIILTFFNWITIAYYIRGEVLREKSSGYVMIAHCSGLNSAQIIFRHLIPNSLTPAISFMPFSVAANITLLVALDFIGFGVPPPTPSWGQLIQQGAANSIIDKWWLVVFPLAIQFFILLLIVFIGEALRETLDPKKYARYK